jgi:hypothetical protein
MPENKASASGGIPPLVQVLTQPRILTVRWSDEGVNIPTPANVVALQLSPDGMILTFGFASPPLLTGSAEAQQKAMESIDEVVGIPHSRVLLSFDRFRELAAIVDQTLTVLVDNGMIKDATAKGET